MAGVLPLGIVDIMICPYCDYQIIQTGFGKADIKYFGCIYKCTEWAENNNIIQYKASWKNKDKKESYRVYASTIQNSTELFHLEYGNGCWFTPDLILKLSYFNPIKDQWDLDGVIHKLLNLKVFS
ncbi:MAG TPA: hypothetical protein VII94_03100 [Candidatus Saccharimonadales bacterium]